MGDLTLPPHTAQDQHGVYGRSARTVTLCAVDVAELPPGHDAMFGMPQIAELDVSLDHILRHPECPLDDALRPSVDRADYVRRHHAAPPAPAVMPLPPPEQFDALWDAEVLEDYKFYFGREDDDPRVTSPPKILSCVDLTKSTPALACQRESNPRPAPPPVLSPSPFGFVYWVLALLLACAAAVNSSQYFVSAAPTEALLPSANNGHSLFTHPPRATKADVVWVPLFEPPDPSDLDTRSEVRPHYRDPPRTRQHMCFVQLTSPSAFAGGVALKAIVQVMPAGNPDTVPISAGIDTLSDVSLALRELLSDIHPIVPDRVRSSGCVTEFAEEGFLDIYHDDQVSRVPALVAQASSLPTNTSVIFGMPALLQLGASLDEQKKEQNAPLICHLGEKTLRSWLEANPTDSVDTKPFNADSIDINPALPRPEQDRIRAIISKHKKAFEGSKDALPKPFDAPPVVLNFVPNTAPRASRNRAGASPAAPSSAAGLKPASPTAPWNRRNLLGPLDRTLC